MSLFSLIQTITLNIFSFVSLPKRPSALSAAFKLSALLGAMFVMMAAASTAHAQVVFTDDINPGETIDLGVVGVGGTETNFDLEIANVGASDLIISNINLTGPNASEFSADIFSTTIAPGGDEFIVLSVNPQAAGVRTATITFNTNDTAQPTLSFNVQATAGVPASISIVSGDNQTTLLGQQFLNSLSFEVLDTGGNRLEGVPLAITTPSSGASAAITFGGNNLSSNADSPNFIQATANNIAGSYGVTISVPGGGPSATFNLTNVAPVVAPANLVVTSGGGQNTAVTTVFDDTLVATVTDANGNPVQGIMLTFVTPSSGASATLSAPSALTDVNGQASVTATANGTVGSYNVTASITNFISLTLPPAIAFALTNTVGAPANLAATSGEGQTTVVSNTIANPFVATVTDSGGNPVQGVTVNFASPGTGASALLFTAAPANPFNTSAVTDVNGQASVMAQANGLAGTYNVTASVAGLPDVTFAHTNAAVPDTTAPTLVSIDFQQGNPTSADSLLFEIIFNEAVQNLDPADFAVAGSTATVAGITQSTSTPGQFNVSVSGGDLAGLNGDVTLSLASGQDITDVAGNPLVNLSPTGVNDSTVTIINIGALAATSGGGQGVDISTPFPDELVATVTDAGGNPVQGVVVNFVAPGTGASATLSATSAETDANGEARITATANTVVGAYNVTASSAGLPDVTFALNNNAGPTTQISIISGNPQSAPLGEQFAAPLVVQVSDANGNPVSSGGVQISVSTSTEGATANVIPFFREYADSNGQVSIIATANNVAGSYAVTVSLEQGSGAVVFNLTNSEGPTVEETQAVIASFLQNRANNIVSNQQDLTRFLPGSSGSSNGPAGSASIDGDENQIAFSFATSRSQLQKARAQKRLTETFALVDENGTKLNTSQFGLATSEKTIGEKGTWDVWVNINGNRSNAGNAESALIVGQVGTHYFFSKNLLLGVSGQIDYADETNDSVSSSADGIGWLITPYLAAQVPNQNVFFELRGGWGQSDNNVSPDGTFEDEFETTRFLVTSKLSGLIELDAFNIKPEVRVSYFEETQESYTDSLNQFIPEQTISLGAVNFGPEFVKNIVLDNGTRLDFSLGLSGVVNFGINDNVASQGFPLGDNSFRARLDGGVKLATKSGTKFNLEGYYDGLGVNDFEAYGASLNVDIPFN